MRELPPPDVDDVLPSQARFGLSRRSLRSFAGTAVRARVVLSVRHGCHSQPYVTQSILAMMKDSRIGGMSLQLSDADIPVLGVDGSSVKWTEGGGDGDIDGP